MHILYQQNMEAIRTKGKDFPNPYRSENTKNAIETQASTNFLDLEEKSNNSKASN